LKPESAKVENRRLAKSDYDDKSGDIADIAIRHSGFDVSYNMYDDYTIMNTAYSSFIIIILKHPSSF
jgi:hypothetical protein